MNMSDPSFEPIPRQRLEQLADDQLADLAEQLAVRLEGYESPDAVIEFIVDRQNLIERIPRTVLEELMRWRALPVRPKADKAEMIRQITRENKMNFKGLSHEALYALARLRGAEVTAQQSDEQLIRALKLKESLVDKFRRKRRRFVGKMVSHLIGDAPPAGEDIVRDGPNPQTLKDRIEEHGLVGGLADKLRGAADDYIAAKLDEIEHRIDTKLDEIDNRLAEWRDREIQTRLRIIKLTLAASVVVALISVVYAWMKKSFGW